MIQQPRVGIELGRGGVPVHDLRTMQCGSAPVFIAGDANNQRPLLHEAADEGHIAGANAAAYPDVEFDDAIIDSLCMHLVTRPERYDIIVLPNLYGDIVSELCAGLVGGIGVAPSANIGNTEAVFEPAHGSAPRYAGKNKVNPIIGAAGVSAVPMAARVAQEMAYRDDPNNHLLMHAIGPNVSGVIGSAIVAGYFLSVVR